jgi:16S rRNA pseudouridine516 synthase
MDIFPCGRLDKNTLGLLILTNNGALAHRLLSPKCHVEKTYRFECERPLRERDIELLCKGVDIGEKSSTQPAKVVLSSDKSGEISVTEGKFHQIKRMFETVHNKIVTLERVTFSFLTLDGLPERGQWRHLTDEEIERLRAHQ